MYIKNNSIEHVNSFSPNNGSFIVWNKQGLRFINDDFVYQGEIVNYHILDSFKVLVENNFEGNKTIVDFKERQETNFNSGIDGIQSVIDENTVLRTIYSEDFSDTLLAKYDLNKNENIWSIKNINNSWIPKNIEFFFSLKQQNLIACYSLKKNEKIWEYDTKSKKGFKIERLSTELSNVEVSKFLGIYNDVLWIILNNGFLLGVDINTGNEKYYLGNALENELEKQWLSELGHVYISSQYKLDDENGKIILINGENYFEVNLKDSNPKKIWSNIASVLNGLKCEMEGNEGFMFDDQYFYFYDGFRGIVLVMDRSSFKIIWEHDLKITTEDSFVLTLLRDLKISENNIGILDRNNTLHIFEKEELQES